MRPTILFALISSIGWGVGSIFDKKATENLHPHTCFVLKTILYLLCALLFSLFTYKEIITDLDLIKSNSNYQKSFLYLLLGTIVVAFIGSVFYFKALKTSDGNTSTVMTIIYVLPLVITLILASIFFSQKLNTTNIMGIVLVFIGLFLLGKN